MWSRSYRNHAIMAFPSFDTVTNSWVPQADISWPTGPVRESEFVRFPIRVLSESEAVSCALSRGKSWIDRRLKHVGIARHGEQGHLLQRVLTLRDNFTETKTNQLSRFHVTDRGSSANPLTFDQFKSAIVRPGVKLSEQSLHKSYAALMRLRKNGQCSWAEIKLKVKHSRERLTLVDSARRRLNSVGLPLTQRDWRRIV
jgi:hypothetical protein